MNNEGYCRYREQAVELVSKMTLEEKVMELCSDSPAIERLGVPSYHWWNEGLHGVARAGVATIFPQAIGMAAAFSKAALKEMGEITALEGRIKYNYAQKEGDHGIYRGLTFWSPNINIYRDPRWGRGHETFGEDPVLTSRCAESYINGVQDNNNGSDYDKAAACVKHFAAHSGPEGCRHGFDSIVSDFDLYDTYLPAFKACVQNADVAGVMGAYNMINGVHSCGNEDLMEGLLRDKWGFRGYYVSDCGALADMHMFCLITHTAVESAALGLKSGCDLNCGQVYLHVLQAYNEGLVTEEQIDRSVIRLFTIRYRLGLLDDNCGYNKLSDYSQIECKEHLEKSYNAAAASVVMLKNNGILPLQRGKYKTIGVIGPNAVNQRALEGNYNGTASKYHYILGGVQKAAGEGTRVLYAQGCHLYKDVLESCANKGDGFSEALSVAEQSDVIFFCAGLDPSIEGEQGDANNEYGAGDKLSLFLPGLQLELLEKLKAVGKPIVLVVLAGGALDMNYPEQCCDAILYGWYPGTMGGDAIADIAFGNISPSGKTPVTFYRSLEDIPAFEDYSMKGRTYRYLEKEPLYPFGFGLTYTSFVYRAPIIEKSGDGGFKARVYVKNTGDTDSDAVVQLYASFEAESEKYIVPNFKLLGFDRTHIKANEEGSVLIEVLPDDLLLTDENGEGYMPQGKVTLHVSGGQPDSRTARLSEEIPATVIL